MSNKPRAKVDRLNMAFLRALRELDADHSGKPDAQAAFNASCAIHYPGQPSNQASAEPALGAPRGANS